MASLPNPHRAPEEWRRVFFGGWRVPALLVAMQGVKIEEEWAVQRAIGMSGWSTIWRGTKPAEGLELTFEAPNESTFDSLRELYSRLAPRTGQRPPTVALRHPAANFVGINRVSRKGWEGPFEARPTSWQVKLTVIQYFPLVVVPVGPQKPAKLPDEPRPTDEGERLISVFIGQLGGLLRGRNP